MNSIDKLIKEKCPNGFEWKPLSELGDIYGGLKGKSKQDFDHGNGKFLNYVSIANNISYNDEILCSVEISENEKQNAIQYGDILFTASSETKEDAGLTCVINKKINEEIYINSFCFGFRFFDEYIKAFNPDFLKHFLRSNSMRKKIVKCCNGVTRFNVSKKDIFKIKLPLIPYDIQTEIANILDEMLELKNNIENQMKKEIELRAKQYEFYKNSLMDFKENENE